MNKKDNIPIDIENHFKCSNDTYKLIDVKRHNKQFYVFVKCDVESHNPYWVSWQHYKNRGDRCSKCRYINNSKKRLIYDADKITKIINEHGYNLIKIDSIGDEGNITISSKEGYVIDTRINNIKKGSKPEFFHLKNQHTIKNIGLWCKNNNRSYILISDTYNKSGKNLVWKCLRCGETFERSWNVVQRGLFECPYCSGKKASKNNNLLINNLELAKQWDYVKNFPVRPENVLPNTTKKYWWICDNCNYGWIKSVHNRNQKIPCPNCKMSKGEHAIKSFLDDNYINYFYEHKFDTCKNIKKLRFDFYLPEHNLCIEYQGEYHYKVINGINNKNALEKQILCDSIKKEFCRKNNILLIEIPHWEYKNIKKLLKEKLI